MPSLPKPDVPTTDDLRIEAANWLRLQELYHLLETTPVEQQPTVLNSVTCDPILRTRVLSLLATASEPRVSPLASDSVVTPETRVGSYAIVRHLGSGGLGSVYLTERILGGAVQQCALKLLAMRSKDASFKARFEREQQILATLQHPNITHLLDAGISETGQPYLVMEFVDGVDLTQYCDERCLPVRRRLEIFLAICDAVTYAHSKLVVHLDLKPSNVLVTADGNVKLLDFGTSKLIESGETMTTTVLATPAYASPEQLRGEPVTTGCDLYSLGTILYELLSGQRPFETASAAMAISRAANEQEPPRLTAAVNAEAAQMRGLPVERLRRMLRGDAASIVARCLRSRSRDRYSSVEALAQDLRRYLAGRPVLARRQTATYRVTKFARRNRLALAVGSVVLLLLLGSGIFAYRRQQQALEQGRRAEQMQTFLSQLIRLANERQTGKPAATVTEFLDLGAKVLPEMIQNSGDRRAAQLSLGESMYDSRDFARALLVLQDAAHNARAANDARMEAEASAFAGLSAYSMGNTQLADALTERGIALAHAHGVGAAARIWIEGAWGLTHATRSIDMAKSVALLGTAVDESRSAGIPDRERLWVLEKLALIEQSSGDYAPASKLADEAYSIVRNQPYALCDRAVILQFQANLVTMRGDDAGSLPIYQRAIDAATACSGADSSFTLSLESLMARALINTGQFDQAIDLLQAALPLWRKSSDGPSMAIALTFLARAYQMHRDYKHAENTARQAIEAQQGKVSPDSTRMAMCYLLISQSLAGRKHYRAALAEAQLANRTYDKIPGMSPIEESYHTQARELLHDLEKKTESASGK